MRMYRGKEEQDTYISNTQKATSYWSNIAPSNGLPISY